MTVRKSQEVVHALTSKGFRITPGDHIFLTLYVNDRQTSVRTKVSRGSREINDYLISHMAYQMKLDKKGFLEYVDCSMTESEYVEDLTRRRILFG